MAYYYSRIHNNKIPSFKILSPNQQVTAADDLWRCDVKNKRITVTVMPTRWFSLQIWSYHALKDKKDIFFELFSKR